MFEILLAHDADVDAAIHLIDTRTVHNFAPVCNPDERCGEVVYVADLTGTVLHLTGVPRDTEICWGCITALGLTEGNFGP